MIELFETARLRVAVPGPEHAAEVARFYAENREHLAPWSPALHPSMLSEACWAEESERRLAGFRAGREARGFLFPIEAPDRVIGNLSLTMITRGVLQACTLGYALAADAQGRGYMVEAVRGAVAYAFQDLRLHRVMANYMPRNRRSAAVLRKAGFVVEGYARDYLRINGRWEDHVMAAVSNPDWRG